MFCLNLESKSEPRTGETERPEILFCPQEERAMTLTVETKDRNWFHPFLLGRGAMLDGSINGEML